MSFFSDAIAAGLAVIRQNVGEAITYKTGTATITIATASPLRGVERENADGRQILDVDELDWGIAKADLKVGDTFIEPATGHTIERVLGSQTLKYSVTPADGDKPWTWSDPGGQTQYRVHTKLIGKS